MKTTQLLPGYTKQGFSAFRSKIFDAADKLNEKNRVLGHLSGAAVKLISKASEYVEVPIRTVETVGLFIINAFGALFNKDFKHNLSHNYLDLGRSLWDIGTTAIIVSYSLITQFVVIYHMASKAISGASQLHNESCKEMIQNLRILGIRKHGYTLIKEFETLFSTSKNRAYQTIEFYKQMVKLHSKELKLFIKKLRAEKETKKPEEKETKWTCPDELKKEATDKARHIKRILHLSDTIRVKGMTKSQIKQYLCNLLGIDPTSSVSQMKKARLRLLFIFHPDRNNDDKFATESFKRLSNVWDQYQTCS